MARTAEREFRVLEEVEHAGIQRVLDYREAELGPALVFEHDAKAARFDRYLGQRHASLALDQRLALIRQLARQWLMPMASASTIAAYRLKASLCATQRATPRAFRSPIGR